MVLVQGMEPGLGSTALLPLFSTPPEVPEAGATAGWFTCYPWCPILWAQGKLFVKWVINGDKDLPGQPHSPAQQDLLQAILSGCSWDSLIPRRDSG